MTQLLARGLDPMISRDPSHLRCAVIMWNDMKAEGTTQGERITQLNLFEKKSWRVASLQWASAFMGKMQQALKGLFRQKTRI